MKQDNGYFVMYYSAPLTSNPGCHCIGTATTTVPDLGSFNESAAEPFICPIDEGGAIDASGFQDPYTGKRYVLYKIDGNSIGNGGECRNTVPPIVPTPIMLQQVDIDGVTKVGDLVTILSRDDSDGPYIEAPSLYCSDEGVYFLFYSSNCFTSNKYDVRYATATKIEGPYTKAAEPLIKTGDRPNIHGPGGAHISSDGHILVFHANMNPGVPLDRRLYTAFPTFSGTTVTI
jgi:beta-xylosidase